MFHPRAIEAANNLIKLWQMKAVELQAHEFFESSDDLMVGRAGSAYQGSPLTSFAFQYFAMVSGSSGILIQTVTHHLNAPV